MTSFLIAAASLLLLALVVLLRPFIFKRNGSEISRRQMNATIYADELNKLDADKVAGLLDEAAYNLAHTEMRQRLYQDTTEEDDVATSRSPKKTIIAICIFVALLSSGIYLIIGGGFQNEAENAQGPMNQEAVEKMVAEFAAKMEKDPEDLKGWAMLARSYRLLGRNEDAEKAYVRAGSFIDSDPQLLADYADTIAINAKGNFAGKPTQLINKALQLDPDNLLALWLSGTASYNAKNYKAAVQAWEKLLKLMPSNTDEARAIEASIDEARVKGKLPPAAKQPISNKGVSGVIDISPALKSKIQATDVVLVIARKPGERMPVAVLKTRAESFPMDFVLNDSLAMSPSALISQLSEVSVEVRISKTGMAMPEPGDLISAAQTVQVGAKNIQLLVNQVRQ
jgi:cytochrome c-type biogenesis protein CcmH